MSTVKERLSNALLKRGVVPQEQLTTLFQESGRSGKSVVRLLAERRLMTEDALTALLSEEFSMPVLPLGNYRVEPAVGKLVPERLARDYILIPISKTGDRLTVAMADPLDVFAIDALKAMNQAAIEPVLAKASEIRRVIEDVYGGGSLAMVDNGKAQTEMEALAEHEELVALLKGEKAPVTKALDLLITEALRKRASDIHLEPMADGIRIRYRVDGHLREAHHLPKAIQSAILTRLKIMSGLDITEWRLPQDGRFKFEIDDRQVDFRVSILPLIHGGKVVMRALDRNNLSIGLENLGFLPDTITRFQEAIKRPHGMILITGPTGSGKSTTLYSILTQLNQISRNLITVEDPVEYQVEGITQVQANPDIGLTFASGLRAILRQNPDVVMIGEIRDFETADIAMKASLTGHLVLSTLHTNDASSAVTRLVDMGVEPFLVASSVTLIEAQRLVRKLCVKCRAPFAPPAELLKRVGAAPTSNVTYYKPVGCQFCNGAGYRGRVGIIEVLVIDEHIRDLVVSKAQSWAIKQYAIEKLGLVTLREDALRKAAIGVTSLEDVAQATAEE